MQGDDKLKGTLIEELVLFTGIVKWLLLATMAGVIVGLATSGFLKLLMISIDSTEKYNYIYLMLPLALFVSAILIKYLAPEAEGHGTEKVIEAVHRRAGKIPFMVVPVKLIATIVTLAIGGSVGKEGPCAQIGAGISSLCADLFKFDAADRKKLVICGISAGFASVFGTPLAGAMFGVEVLFIGTILYDVLLPSFIAGITSYHVSVALGITYFRHPVIVTPVFSEFFFLKVVLAGIFFGICSLVLIEAMDIGKNLSDRFKIWQPLKGVIGGILLIFLTLVSSREYLGLGLNTIESCLNGSGMPWYAFLLKSAFTSITLNSCGSGGIVTPIFFIGATSGTLFAHLLGLDIATFAAIGLVSVLAGAANTPIAACIMSIELYGPELAPYASVACVISFLMSGYRSVYPTQILSMSKDPALQAEIGGEIRNIRFGFSPRKSLTLYLFELLRSVFSKISRN